MEDLKELLQIPSEGSGNRATIRELYETKCAAIPCENGLYFVETAKEELFFLPDAVEQGIPAYPVAELQQKWEAGDRRCLYIGKAKRRGGLRKRLWEYIRYGYGLGKNHRGGRAIWQVQDFETLTIRWVPVENAEQLEHDLLRSYKNACGCYPMANRRG